MSGSSGEQETAPASVIPRRSEQHWLDRPLSGLSCVLAWALATAIFMCGVALFGGPSEGDSTESVYATWAIAHGDIACSNPPITSNQFLLAYQPGPEAPPLWPLISAGLAAAVDIGHDSPFPSQHSFGTGCRNAYTTMYRWADGSLALVPTVGLGYATWFGLLAGLIALVRAVGRGRRGWEALAVLLVAAVPVVWGPLLELYHPQDLLAMGLALGGVACAIRERWVWAGLLLGLAVTSQQFALLLLLPLAIVASNRRRWILVLSSAASWAVISVPMLILTSGREWRAIVLGTGDYTSLGGTVLADLGLSQSMLHFCSRFLPLLLSAAIAGWALHRLGRMSLEVVPLISLLATCLSMRLVFEQGIFGYKFMALAVMLVVLDVARGRVRGLLLAWLALVTVGLNPIPVVLDLNARPWGANAVAVLEIVFIIVSLTVIVVQCGRRRMPPVYLFAILLLGIGAFLQWPPWAIDSLREPLPKWLWQLALVPTGVVLAVGPLIRSFRALRGVSLGPEVAFDPVELSHEATGATS